MSVSDEGAGELQGSERHAPLLECEDIVVDFGSNRALDGVSLSIRPGEIIGLVGPNGAGKSTLGRVFVGELPYGSYDGLLQVGGVQTQFRDTRDAHRRGVVLIHQEGAAVRDLSIGENVMLTVEPRRFGIIDWNALHERAELALRQLGVTADTRTRLADVGGVALEEMVEIARSLVRGSKVFVFDESTAALGIDEVKILLKRMHELAGRGAGIVFISHRLDEVLSVCDRIVVLRDGRICLDSQRSDEDHSSVLSAMLGEDVAASEADAASKTGDALAACAAVESEQSAVRLRGWRILKSDLSAISVGPIDIDINKGDILGVFGPLGAGKTEFLSSLYGLFGDTCAGEFNLHGERVRIHHPVAAIRRGLAFVTSDRQNEGVVPQLSVEENMMIGYHPTNLQRSGIVLNHAKIRVLCQDLIGELGIQTTGPEQMMSSLSGGNQQKILLSRTMINAPQILLLDEPTRGIDVGAKRDVYRWIKTVAAEGAAVIVSTHEEEELLGIAHRILVIRDGRQIALLEASKTDRHELLALAAGGELG